MTSPDAYLEPQLVGNALFTPRYILNSHAPNQRAKFYRNSRPPCPTLEPPEKPPSSPVPADHRRRPNDDQGAPPVEHPPQSRQTGPARRIYPTRLDPTLHEQCELATQKEVLGTQRCR